MLFSYSDSRMSKSFRFILALHYKKFKDSTKWKDRTKEKSLQKKRKFNNLQCQLSDYLFSEEQSVRKSLHYLPVLFLFLLSLFLFLIFFSSLSPALSKTQIKPAKYKYMHKAIKLVLNYSTIVSFDIFVVPVFTKRL